MEPNYKLISNDKLTELARQNGINSWNELKVFVKNLPYGRNENRFDFGLVLSEKKGSCSSKHALLKRLADLNEIPDVRLMLGIYKMNQYNTPNIGPELAESPFDFIPEAHCYLKINQKSLDFTTDNSEFERIKNDLIQEIEIEPEQVSDFKVTYHKEFLRKWIDESNFNLGFDELWKLREKCIENLTRQPAHNKS